MSKERFWAKIDVQGEDECWEWLANKSSKGYGRFWLNGKQWIAHRVAWALTYGPIPKGVCVLHHCDNPPCCNPAHLWLGSVADNNADMVAKGRSTHGERNGRSKLTEINVLEIRRLYDKTDLTQHEIGGMFNVCKSTIGNIVRGERWGWL